MADTVVWVDSDASVNYSILQRAGFQVAVYTDTLPAFAFIQANKSKITCLLTSSMKRGGREEKGLPSGLVLGDMVTDLYGSESYKPLLAFITLTADEQEVLERGFSIYVRNDRGQVQNEIVAMLKSSINRDFRVVRKNNVCNYEMRQFAREVAESLCKENEFAQYHNTFADLCFCARCEPERIQLRSGERYALPQGWFGFGIQIRKDFANNRSAIESWHVGFHGTKQQVVESVLRERRIMFPGDKLTDGTVLQVAHGQAGAGGKAVIYVSPTVNYAAHPLYAAPFDFHGKVVQVALQCRVRPGSYKVQGNTIAGGTASHIDPDIKASGQYDVDFGNHEVEWVIADRAAVVPYRLLIRWFD